MCGIFGVLSDEPVVNKIVKGLHKLEYRGYDSSGISLVINKKIQTIRAQGKLKNLKKKLSNKKFEGTLGIGHTCLLYTSPSPRDRSSSRMPSSA